MDLAEYSFDNGQWQGGEEIFRIDNILRTNLGYQLKEEAGAQPWINKDPDLRDHKLSLKFVIHSEIESILLVKFIIAMTIMLSLDLLPGGRVEIDVPMSIA